MDRKLFNIRRTPIHCKINLINKVFHLPPVSIFEFYGNRIAIREIGISTIYSTVQQDLIRPAGRKGRDATCQGFKLSGRITLRVQRTAKWWIELDLDITGKCFAG